VGTSVGLQNRRSGGSIPPGPAKLTRRCPAGIFEQFEPITKQIDAETEEIVGVKCRFCGEVILDEATARQLLGAGAVVSRQSGTDPLLAALAVIAAPLLLWGGIHMLTCRRTKMN